MLQHSATVTSPTLMFPTECYTVRKDGRVVIPARALARIVPQGSHRTLLFGVRRAKKQSAVATVELLITEVCTR